MFLTDCSVYERATVRDKDSGEDSECAWRW
jgi:hypothetical protein